MREKQRSPHRRGLHRLTPDQRGFVFRASRLDYWLSQSGFTTFGSKS